MDGGKNDPRLRYFGRTPEKLEAEIKEAESKSEYTCTNCGCKHEPCYNIQPIKPISLKEWCECGGRDRMEKEKVCMRCAIWLDICDMTIRAPKKKLIFNGNHNIGYPYEETPVTKSFRGFGGAVFYFLMNDGSTFMTNNMWHQGDIPDIFRDKMPDNCEQITKEEYKKLTKV